MMMSDVEEIETEIRAGNGGRKGGGGVWGSVRISGRDSYELPCMLAIFGV
jgi:hypothetical protein